MNIEPPRVTREKLNRLTEAVEEILASLDGGGTTSEEKAKMAREWGEEMRDTYSRVSEVEEIDPPSKRSP